MRLTRRHMLAGLVAGAVAPAANAHTMYNQWIVYRQKNLLIGSHRKDLGTYSTALQLAEVLEHLLPEASARAARAPHPERLASLLGTRQLELAVLSAAEVGEMRDGTGKFAPYGAIPLTLVAQVDTHLLVAHRDFTPHHGWLVASALDQSGIVPGETEHVPLPSHAGVDAFLDGVPMENLMPL
ncbi:MAG: hypothetical protein AB8B58_00135 [Roseobacter sp.]